jgi:DNA invertase Pin-like site-specific DNA recombinase
MSPRSVGRVIAYVRVSTEEQGLSGAGLAAQRAAVEAACAQRGWQLVELVEEVQSAKGLQRRPKLHAALQRLRAGEADALVVAKLDRLSRSVHDLSGLLLRAQQERWALVAFDTAVDEYPNGRGIRQHGGGVRTARTPHDWPANS